MKTMIPATAGTYLLVPYLGDEPDNQETFFGVTRVPVLGWSNYSAAVIDAPDVRTRATPITPFWPDGVAQAAGYLIPDEQGGFSISVPFAKRTFLGPNAKAQYEHFAEELLRGMAAERVPEEPMGGFEEPADLRTERREDRDEGEMVSIALPDGTYSITPAEDTREIGTTNAGGARRTKAEIAADELFLDRVQSLGKTIRAVNTRWKTTPSRIAVLRDLAGVKDDPMTAEAAEYQTVPFPADEDEDLIG